MQPIHYTALFTPPLIRCVLDALMLSMKRWARFPHSRTGYAPPLYSYTAYTHRLSGPCTVYDDTADPVYSDAAYTLYSAIHSPSASDAFGVGGKNAQGMLRKCTADARKMRR